MHCLLWSFPASPELTKTRAEALFALSGPCAPGQISKYLGEAEGGYAIVTMWNSKAEADAFYTEEFMAAVATVWGVRPTRSEWEVASAVAPMLPAAGGAVTYAGMPSLSLAPLPSRAGTAITAFRDAFGLRFGPVPQGTTPGTALTRALEPQNLNSPESHAARQGVMLTLMGIALFVLVAAVMTGPTRMIFCAGLLVAYYILVKSQSQITWPWVATVERFAERARAARAARSAA